MAVSLEGRHALMYVPWYHLSTSLPLAQRSSPLRPLQAALAGRIDWAAGPTARKRVLPWGVSKRVTQLDVTISVGGSEGYGGQDAGARGRHGS